MGKRIIVVLLVGLTLASTHFAGAQQPTGKVKRIGIFAAGSVALIVTGSMLFAGGYES